MNGVSMYDQDMPQPSGDRSPINNDLPDPPEPPGRGRRPAAEVRADILAAAGQLLLAKGMDGFTIEGVATLAGASKTTIYKWWPSAGALALDGYFAAVSEVLSFPDTGDITADLISQLTSFVHLLRDTQAGAAIAALIGESQSDPELASAYRQHYSRPRRDLAVVALNRAKARDQVRDDIDPEVLIDQLWGACYHRLLVPDEPLTDDFVRDLVTNLVTGIVEG